MGAVDGKVCIVTGGSGSIGMAGAAILLKEGAKVMLVGRNEANLARAVERLGAGMGMQGTVMDIGHASGPLLAGLLIAHVSYQGAFAVIAGLQILAAIAFWATMRTLSR